MDPVLKIKNLRVDCTGGFSLELDDFSVEAGEHIGIVGPNGAGKSILIESMLGIRQRSAGDIQVLGTNLSQRRMTQPVRRRIGAQLQNGQLPGLARVSELVRTHRLIYGVQDGAVIDLLGINELSSKLVRQLSRGQNQRLHLFLALAHKPELILLDEPTLGLDEKFSRALHDHLRSASMRKSTLLLISHLPADLAALHRLICLKNGRRFDEGSLQEMMRRHAGDFKGRIYGQLPDFAASELRRLPGVFKDRFPAGAENDEGITVYGDIDFSAAFRQFIQDRSIDAFSLEPTNAGDFLSKIANG